MARVLKWFQECYWHLHHGFGRTLRETGLALDRRGSLFTSDAAFLEPHNRHRNIVPLYARTPVIPTSTYVAPNATIVGSVYCGPNSYFGFGSAALTFLYPIRIGRDTKIGDNSIINSSNWSPADAFSPSANIGISRLLVGNRVTIEHNCKLYTCYIDDDVHVGFGTTIGEGAQLERGSVISPNSYVPAGRRIPAHTLWAGSPVQFVRDLADNETLELHAKDPHPIKLPE